MSRKMPPLAWFRAFESAARHLSFTRAADELGVTQSAVSQHVRSLEHRFGMQLFQRHARGIALTDDGRRLIPDVSRAIGSLAAVTNAFDTTSDGPVLTLAASISIIQSYLVPSISSFRARWSALSIRIISATWPDEYHAPLADVEVRFGSPSLAGKGAIRLQPDEQIVVAAPGVAGGLRALTDTPLIQPVGTSDTWASWATVCGVELAAEPALFVDSHGLAVDLARRGAGIALTSSLIARPYLRDGSLVAIDAPTAPIKDGYHLAINASDKPAAVDFRAWLLDEISAVG